MLPSEKERLRLEAQEKARLEAEAEARRKEREKERFILCIDGGGMRGIIPVVVLIRLEQILREHGINRSAASCFDMIAGTSTGGLISLSLSCAEDNTLDTLFNTYLHMGKKIFPQSTGLLHSLVSLASDKYSPEGLDRLLYDWFGDKPLTNASIPTMIISYDLASGHDFVMKSWDETEGIKVREAGRATSSAPTYFPPLRFKNHILIDGGVIANNPASFAYTEAKKLWPECKKFTILSICTGATYHSLSQGMSGIIPWAEHMFPMMSTAQKRSVDYVLNGMPDVDYIRLDQSLAERVQMDETDPAVLRKLVNFGEKLAGDSNAELEKLAEKFEERYGEKTDAS